MHLGYDVEATYEKSTTNVAEDEYRGILKLKSIFLTVHRYELIERLSWLSWRLVLRTSSCPIQKGSGRDICFVSFSTFAGWLPSSSIILDYHDSMALSRPDASSQMYDSTLTFPSA